MVSLLSSESCLVSVSISCLEVLDGLKTWSMIYQISMNIVFLESSARK